MPANEGLELVMTRTLDAPRDLVWRALTDPEHFSKWWVPEPYTAPVIKMDVREGGNMLWGMESPEGVRLFHGGRFTAVQAPGLLACVVYLADENGKRVEPTTAGFPPDWDGNETITFTLEDLGDRTRLTMRHTGIPSGEIREMAAGGWLNCLDKLHESLVEGHSIVLTRVLEAPRELVWKAWTDPEHLDNWWGPNGFTTKTKEHELRVGGVWRHDMVSADGKVFPDRTEYLEIVEPDQLVYLLGDDDNHEMARTTVSFIELAGQTHVNMILVFKDKGVRDSIAEEHGAIEGGKQTLQKLADYLTAMRKE